MTNKEQIWLAEYLTCWNASEAARRAGYKWPKKVGPRLKTKMAGEIQAAIDARMMSADEVLARTADIARGDLAAYITADGGVDLAALRAEGKGHLLKKYRVHRSSRMLKNGETLETESVEVEFYPADAAHDKLMRYHGLYNDRVRLTTWQDEIVDLLRRGEIQPADVEAAYPELATDFFARAGIDASPAN